MGRLIKSLALGCMVGASLCVLLVTHDVAAVSGFISFQGKLTNPDGTNVTDGGYSIRFRIYTDPSADAVSSCLPASNTCKWEEVHGAVDLSAGLFHVNLGSAGSTLPGSVDFNGPALYLGVKVASDSEMTPRVLLTASPQAFNSDLLDGMDSSNFVQLSPGSQQTGSINISGTITSGAVNGISIGSTIQPSSAGALTIQSSGSNNLTIGSGSGTIALGASTLQRTASGATSLDLIDGANTVLNVTNSGAGTALINADGYQAGGTPGISATCSGGQFVQGQVVTGGIVTGGSCGSLPIRSFVDTTADAVVDNNTTSYWDNAAENNNTRPNITPSATDKEIFGILTMETQATGTADVEVTARVERSTSGSTACNSGTAVGGQPGTFASNTNARKTSTTSFMDAPASTGTQYYNVCADTDTVGTTANVTRLRMTLFEVDSSNADLAELYPSLDQDLMPGELLTMDANIKNGVKRTAGANDQKIVGVVSTSPALLIGGTDGQGTAVPVALTGRVPVLVSSENGPIQPGDPLTSSSTPGVAMKALTSGYVIGRAMGSFDGPGEGAVIAFVGTHYYAPLVAATDLQSAAASVEQFQIKGQLTVSGQAYFMGTLHAEDVVIGGSLLVGPDTAGTALIPAGQTNTEVRFGHAHTQTPKVFTGASSFLPVKIDNKTPEGFRLTIPASQEQDLTIDWFAVEASD